MTKQVKDKASIIKNRAIIVYRRGVQSRHVQVLLCLLDPQNLLILRNLRAERMCGKSILHQYLPR